MATFARLFPRIEACARIAKAPVPLILFLALPASALVSIVKTIGMRTLFHEKPCQFHLPHNFDKSRYFLSRHFTGCGLFFSHLGIGVMVHVITTFMIIAYKPFFFKASPRLERFWLVSQMLLYV